MRRGDFSSLLLGCAAALVALIVPAHVYLGWLHYAGIDHVSGAWMTLVSDLKEGSFYRRLFDGTAYGGTRYFPLHFALHAGLLKLGAEPRAAGYALAVVATVALLIGVYVFLRDLEVGRHLAFCSSTLVLAVGSAQVALVSTRGDVLPAALNIPVEP